MRKYLEFADAQYLRENVPGSDIAAAFAQRINFGADAPDSHDATATSTSSG